MPNRFFIVLAYLVSPSMTKKKVLQHCHQGITEVPIWQQPVKTEAVEGATELAEVPGEKTKQLKEKPAVNLRRKSSNLRGDHDHIGEHDPAGIPNSKLEQVPTLYTFFCFVADNVAKETCNVCRQ
jgi:hypothetical protein